MKVVFEVVLEFSTPKDRHLIFQDDGMYTFNDLKHRWRWNPKIKEIEVANMVNDYWGPALTEITKAYEAHIKNMVVE